MHVIITGATGTVGVAVLRHCLASPNITQLSILSRRQFALPTGDGLDVKKASVIVHQDYSTYPDELLSTVLRGAGGCIWAQGVSQSEVSKDEYIRITHDYPIAAAKAFSSLSNTGKFNFVYVSGEGADPTEKTFTLFGKIKGRTEAALLALPSTPAYSALRVYNVRPGYVDSLEHYRPRSVLKKAADFVIAPSLRLLLPSQVSPTGVLSKVLVDLATGDGNALQESGSGIEAGGRTVRSIAIRRLGEL